MGARLCAFMAGLAALAITTTARAQDWSAVVVPEPSASRREMWFGAETSGNSWSAYTGVTFAPFGPIGGDGWRIRIVGGYGAYNYETLRNISGKFRSKTFRGTVSFADALVGYQMRYSPLTLKVLAGISAMDHQITPFDAEHTLIGPDLGFNGMIEAWLDMNERNWASLNLSWSSARDSYASRLRYGFTVWPETSFGLEAAATGDAGYGGGRGGAFVRHTWGNGEITASGGPSLDSTMTVGAYGTLNVLTRF
jgi:hypothetical protein